MIIRGDNIQVLKGLEDNFIDACITDPPYGMGMEHWDYSVPTVELWKEVFRVLKPGAFCLSFCSTDLYHRMAVGVEDAGFNIRDMVMWIVTTKMVKKNRLKPAHEPIVVAQKPFTGSIKNNFEKWGTGIIDTDNTRVAWEGKPPTGWIKGGHNRRTFGKDGNTIVNQKDKQFENANPKGRYPSNIIGHFDNPEHQKYFYAPRVSTKERAGINNHPTPKPVDLMSYLVKVYSPDGGKVLDPFCGSGSTGVACKMNGKEFVGIELEKNYCEIAEKRISQTNEKNYTRGLTFDV
mgnify:FL=1